MPTRRSPCHGSRGTRHQANSWLGVPILAGGGVLGVVSLERQEAHAFSEADERLLATLTSSMGVALENARLFVRRSVSYRRPMSEPPSWPIVNSVQEGLAENLDMQAMYDLVGDKIQEIFDAQVVDIGIADLEAGLIHYPYTIERGVRLPRRGGSARRVHAHPGGAGGPGAVCHRRRRGVDGRARSDVDPGRAGTLHPRRAPDERAARHAGGSSLQNLDRTHAFGESDRAAPRRRSPRSLSVALENARLFDETRRLLAETDRRAAELAIVNSVQRGLAAELDIQAMYELVGERASDVFDAQVVDIAIFDHARARHAASRSDSSAASASRISRCRIIGIPPPRARDARAARRHPRPRASGGGARAAGAPRGRARAVSHLCPAGRGRRGPRYDLASRTSTASTRSTSATSRSLRRSPPA